MRHNVLVIWYNLLFQWMGLTILVNWDLLYKKNNILSQVKDELFQYNELPNQAVCQFNEVPMITWLDGMVVRSQVQTNPRHVRCRSNIVYLRRADNNTSWRDVTWFANNGRTSGRFGPHLKHLLRQSFPLCLIQFGSLVVSLKVLTVTVVATEVAQTRGCTKQKFQIILKVGCNCARPTMALAIVPSIHSTKLLGLCVLAMIT